MSDSIILSLSIDGDSVSITTQTTTGGLLLSKMELLSYPKMELLSYLEKFIGERCCFYRKPIEPKPVNWLEEMARSFGVSAFDLARLNPEAADCQDCGRLMEDPGLCPCCADIKSRFNK